MEDVTVMKSIRLTNLDFDEDLDWDLSEEDLLPRFRMKRQVADPNETLSSEEPFESIANETVTELPNIEYYHHPVFPPDDFVTIKILDLEFDESNEKMIIYLGTEMKKDIYYIVKVNFTGNMTNDKGLYVTHYKDGESNHKLVSRRIYHSTNKYYSNKKNDFRFIAATILEPNNARKLYPCMDDHNFR